SGGIERFERTDDLRMFPARRVLTATRYHRAFVVAHWLAPGHGKPGHGEAEVGVEVGPYRSPSTPGRRPKASNASSGVRLTGSLLGRVSFNSLNCAANSESACIMRSRAIRCTSWMSSTIR